MFTAVGEVEKAEDFLNMSLNPKDQKEEDTKEPE